MCSTQLKQNEDVSTNHDLKSHLEALKRRNMLLKQLRDAQLTHAKSKAKSPPSRKVVKQALRRARDEGNLPTPVLRQIVELTRQDGTTEPKSRPITAPQAATATTRRRPLAPAAVNHAEKDPRLKLNLAALGEQQKTPPPETRADWIPRQTAQTARTDGSYRKKEDGSFVPHVDHQYSERAAPATARPGCPILTKTAARSGTRYHKLLIALQLEAPSQEEPDATLRASDEGCEMREDSDPSEPVTYTPPNTHRQRASSFTSSEQIEMSVKMRLKVEGGEGKKSLPGSPGWTDDMNPAHQPDGEFSLEKKHEFCKGVRNLLRILRCGGTLLETRVASKRSKQNQEMWMATRNEAQAGRQASNNNVAAAMHCRTSDWKITNQGIQANFGHTTNSTYGRDCARGVQAQSSNYHPARRVQGRAFRV